MYVLCCKYIVKTWIVQVFLVKILYFSIVYNKIVPLTLPYKVKGTMKGIIIICTTCLLVSKYFVCRYTFDRCKLFERLDVEVLLVAKDKVAPRLLCHVVVLKLNYILKCERRQSCVYLTANIVVDATLLGREVRARMRLVSAAECQEYCWTRVCSPSSCRSVRWYKYMHSLSHSCVLV